MSLFRRFFPYNKQWCVVLSLISALSWSFMDLYAGLNREIVDGATITFVNGAAICCLAVPALYLYRHELKVRLHWCHHHIRQRRLHLLPSCAGALPL